VRLLLDEMYSPVVAEQLRARGHDVVSIHDRMYHRLRGVPDAEVFAAARAEARVVVTDNIADFRQFEAEALAGGDEPPLLIFTTNRQFPRADAATIGRLVLALDALLRAPRRNTAAIFLRAE
jgi:predicted nuclease of predicted toxin-antitoxin system